MSDNRKPPDYDSIEHKQWKDAQKELSSEIRDRAQRVLKRIAAFAAKFDFDEQEVLEKAEKDDMFAAQFATEPRRTRLHEIAAGK